MWECGEGKIKEKFRNRIISNALGIRNFTKKVLCTFFFALQTTKSVMSTPMSKQTSSEEDEELTALVVRCLRLVYSFAFAEPAHVRLHFH